MNDDIKWFYLKQKNSEHILSRVNLTFYLVPKSELETNPNVIIGCFENEMELDFFEEIIKFDLEVMELKD